MATEPSPRILDEDAAWARRTADGWLLTVRVQPGARRSAVVGALGDALKIQVAAPAVDNKANAELVRFLAAELGVPGRAVSLVRGATARTKQVAVRLDRADR